MLRKSLALLFALLLIMVVFVLPVSATVATPSDGTILPSGSVRYAIGDDGTIVKITVFDIDENVAIATHMDEIMKMRATSVLYTGYISLNLGLPRTWLAETIRTGLFNQTSIISCYNYGDNQGNGAVTFHTNGVDQAVASGQGCQFEILSFNSSSMVYAHAEWYAASYNLYVTQD